MFRIRGRDVHPSRSGGIETLPDRIDLLKKPPVRVTRNHVRCLLNPAKLQLAEALADCLHLSLFPSYERIHSFKRNFTAISEILAALKVVDSFSPVGQPTRRVRDEARIISQQGLDLAKQSLCLFT